MEITTMLAIVQASRAIITGIVQQATLAKQAGQITDGQLQAIVDEAKRSDTNWDDRVADARARLGDDG